jgi:hypothetical protein
MLIETKLYTTIEYSIKEIFRCEYKRLELKIYRNKTMDFSLLALR